jgi:predicted nucleic acid-binding protein
MNVVCNSTPLIALAKINQLRLLKEFFDEIVIPEEVYDDAAWLMRLIPHNAKETCRRPGRIATDKDAVGRRRAQWN